MSEDKWFGKLIKKKKRMKLTDCKMLDVISFKKKSRIFLYFY